MYIIKFLGYRVSSLLLGINLNIVRICVFFVLFGVYGLSTKVGGGGGGEGVGWGECGVK